MEIIITKTITINKCYHECPHFELEGGPGPVMTCVHPEAEDDGYIISHPECDNGFPEKCPLIYNVKKEKTMTELKKYRVLGYLFEESLSRVWQHAGPERGFILTSAFIDGDPKFDNMAKHEALKAELKRRGVGYFVVDGYEILPGKEDKHELSVFVPYDPKMTSDEFLNLARDLREKFDQNFTIVRLPNEKELTVIPKQGAETKDSMPLHPDRIAQYYSRLRTGHHKGRPFAFGDNVRPDTKNEEAEVAFSVGVEVAENYVAGIAMTMLNQLT